MSAGPVAISVVVGDDDPKDGVGVLKYLVGGVWRYYLDSSELGLWRTVVILTAVNAISNFGVREGEDYKPPTPPAWMQQDCVSPADFLAATIGMTPRTDMQFWVQTLLQSNPIPLTPAIKQGLIRAYPSLFN